MKSLSQESISKLKALGISKTQIIEMEKSIDILVKLGLVQPTFKTVAYNNISKYKKDILETFEPKRDYANKAIKRSWGIRD